MGYEDPQFFEINLDAEVGSYEDDFSDVPVLRRDAEPFPARDPPADDPK